MITPRLFAWGGIVVGWGAIGWSLSVPLNQPAVAVAPASAAEVAVPTLTQVDSSRILVRKAPFRAGRVPAAVGYNPVAQATPSTTPVPKPVLTLVGVVSGTNPSAVVDGFPGVEGSRVVQANDAIGGLRVESITADHVRIVGLDTVWVLRVKQTWD